MLAFFNAIAGSINFPDFFTRVFINANHLGAAIVNQGLVKFVFMQNGGGVDSELDFECAILFLHIHLPDFFA